jgi:hypothetical protein
VAWADAESGSTNASAQTWAWRAASRSAGVSVAPARRSATIAPSSCSAENSAHARTPPGVHLAHRRGRRRDHTADALPEGRRDPLERRMGVVVARADRADHHVGVLEHRAHGRRLARARRLFLMHRRRQAIEGLLQPRGRRVDGSSARERDAQRLDREHGLGDRASERARLRGRGCAGRGRRAVAAPLHRGRRRGR